MAEYNKRLGCLQSPWDNKRLLYMLRRPTYEEAQVIPEEWDGLADYLPCLGNQGDIGSCCGWAGKGLEQTLIKLNDKLAVDISAGSIYYHSREYIDPPLDPSVQGSTPLGVMKLLAKQGATTEECTPTDVQRPFELAECPEWESIASKYKILSYHQVPVDQASMKAAIYGVTYKQPYAMPDGSFGKAPLYVAIPVYRSFYEANTNGGIVLMPQANETLEGGHAILFRGWKKIGGKDYWVAVNSWGKDVGDQGIYYLPVSYPIWEAWMITDDPSLSPEPGPTPEPEPGPTPEPEPEPSPCRVGNGIASLLNLFSKVAGRKGRFMYFNPRRG